MSIFSSCYYDIEEELYPTGSTSNCDTTALSYIADIRPIIDAKCATSGCHVAGGSGPGDYTVYANLFTVVQNGKLRERVLNLQNMPPSGALSSCDQLKIEHWINNGAKQN
ncbi:MAG: hypothetical protein HKN22_00570 [Bacteroidia bacterium]|nr:hypothetical protein [Bacteroidia bacterium]